MSVEDISLAMVNRIIEGDVISSRGITQADVNQWTGHGHVHAIANGIVILKLALQDAEFLNDKKESEQMIQKILSGLRERGWQGQTKEDFEADYEEVKLEFKKSLSDDDWKKYFDYINFLEK